jgi:hypothetical protein
MQKYKYLVVAEIGREGFITEMKDSFEEADRFSQELFSLANVFPISKRSCVAQLLQQKGYLHYKINGNQIYFPSPLSSITDGDYSVSVINILPGQNCIRRLIKERENHSIVFKLEMIKDEFVERFPRLGLIAN